MNVVSTLYECKHCSGTGTCQNGPDGFSCAACIKKNELGFWSRRQHKGLMCGACGGIGRAEPLTERMNKRIAPVLAIVLTFSLIIMVSLAALLNSTHFNELLAFSSAIIGTVVGFYFSSKSTKL